MPGLVRDLPKCDNDQVDAMRGAVSYWSEKLVWPVGSEVQVQWTLNQAKTAFTLTAMNSDAWNGLEFNLILTLIYQ